MKRAVLRIGSVLGISVLVFVLAAQPAAGGPPDGAGAAGIDYVDGRVLVKFKPGAGPGAQAAAHAAAGAKVEKVIPGLGVTVVSVAKGATLGAVNAYAGNPSVLYAEVDAIVSVSYACDGSETPDGFSADDCSWRQWGLHNSGDAYDEDGSAGFRDADIDAAEAHASADGAGVVIAILDTGYDTTHEDLAGKVVGSRDLTGEGIEDLHGHGTWTASLAAANTANTAGIAGVAPDADLLVVKVLNQNGAGSWSQIADGIRWAADQAADVISMSLGGTCRLGRRFVCNALQDAVSYAASQGSLLVAAAGNGGSSGTEYPGAFPEVIAVAATDARDARASFSDYGNVAAPGVNVMGAFPDCDGGGSFTLQQSNGKECSYDYGSGTSAATPLVAGVAALVWSHQPNLTSTQVREAIEGSAQDLPGDFDGAGRVSACSALNFVDPGACDEVVPPLPAMSVSDLDGNSGRSGNGWRATVTVEVRDEDGQPVSGAAVSGAWSGGWSGSDSCQTGADGRCAVSTGRIARTVASATLTVTAVAHPNFVYDASGNADADGDSDGNSITVQRP